MSSFAVIGRVLLNSQTSHLKSTWVALYYAGHFCDFTVDITSGHLNAVFAFFENSSFFLFCKWWVLPDFSEHRPAGDFKCTAWNGRSGLHPSNIRFEQGLGAFGPICFCKQDLAAGEGKIWGGEMSHPFTPMKKIPPYRTIEGVGGGKMQGSHMCTTHLWNSLSERKLKGAVK